MNIKSKAFWLQVKEEYRGSTFICSYSDTFKEVWTNPERGKDGDCIRKLGRTFLKETKQNPAFIIGEADDLLFDTITGYPQGDTWEYSDCIGLRLLFIDWCINKFD